MNSFTTIINYIGGPGDCSRYSHSLRPERSADPNAVGTKFSKPGAQPASYTMGMGSFPEVRRPGRGVDHSPPSSTEVKKE